MRVRDNREKRRCQGHSLRVGQHLMAGLLSRASAMVSSHASPPLAVSRANQSRARTRKRAAVPAVARLDAKAREAEAHVVLRAAFSDTCLVVGSGNYYPHSLIRRHQKAVAPEAVLRGAFSDTSATPRH